MDYPGRRILDRWSRLAQGANPCEAHAEWRPRRPGGNIWSVTVDGMAVTGADRLIGGSAATKELRAIIARVAPHRSTVLIRGESGTGKELVARAIHEGS